MKRRLLPLLFAAAAWSGAASAETFTVQPRAELVIDGKSTVRDFSCRAKSFSADLAPGTGTSLALDQLATAVGEVDLEIPVKDLDCANDTMNEHMLEALKADQFPTIRLHVSRYEAGAVADGLAPLKLVGELTLAGVTRPVTLMAQARPAASGGLRVEGRYLLKMTDWGVKPPSLMLGTMKVREAVLIRFDLTVQ